MPSREKGGRRRPSHGTSKRCAPGPSLPRPTSPWRSPSRSKDVWPKPASTSGKPSACHSRETHAARAAALTRRYRHLRDDGRLTDAVDTAPTLRHVGGHIIVSDLGLVVARLVLKQEIEDFLYAEAELL